MPPRLIALLLIVALAVVGGCTQSQVRGKAERPVQEIAFDAVTDTAVVAPGEAGLTALDVFLARNGARYGDRLVAAAPPEVLETLRLRYAAMGVRVLRAPGARNSPAAGPFRVTFSRLTVTPPPCGDWSDADAYDGDNQPAPNWGCADRSNLARMVADPHDLLAGREARGGYDTAADAAAIRAYRAGLIDMVTVEGESVTTGD